MKFIEKKKNSFKKVNNGRHEDKLINEFDHNVIYLQ